MDDVTPVSEMTQTDVNALLARLKILQEQIAEKRATLVPLEAKMTMIYKEYQAAISPGRRDIEQAQAELYALQDRIEQIALGQEMYSQIQEKMYQEQQKRPTIHFFVEIDPERGAKDTLLEHLGHILDHMTNDEDAELLSHVHGIFKNPKARLVDALECIPWGTVWIQRKRYEDLSAQYKRLLTWEDVLTRQLHILSQAIESLHLDTRYGLWEQYQKGYDIWHKFLQRVIQQQYVQRDEIAQKVLQLQADLAEMEERA